MGEMCGTWRVENRSASAFFVDTFSERGYTSRFLSPVDRAQVWIEQRHGGRSSVGRALEWHSRGQGFDSPRLHPDATPYQAHHMAVRIVGPQTRRRVVGAV